MTPDDVLAYGISIGLAMICLAVGLGSVGYALSFVRSCWRASKENPDDRT